MERDADEFLDELMITDEGMRAKPYVDTVGKVTIGIGRNLTDRGLSQSEIHFLYENDKKMAIGACQAIFGDYWWDLSDVRKIVLINMAFNLGQTRLSQFKQTIAAVKAEKYALAADQMLRSKWAKQVGQRARRLAKMMRTGELP